jgi:hypothetical protein
MQPEQDQKKRTNYFDFSEVANYFFRKKDPNRPKNFSLSMMHGVNKISIIMFLICLIVIISRFVMRAL